MNITIEQVQQQLLNYFDGDVSRVKELARGCNEVGFKISDNLEAISKNPEKFLLLISYSDLGILGKLADVLEQMRKS